MRKLVVGTALALLVLASSNASAFQEQKGEAAPAPQAQPPAQSAPDSGLGLSSEAAPASEKGTEIRIPGLGKLGVLPKMDFGLELLYGAAEQRQPEGPVENVPTTPEDDLMIRGSVKHRF